jgi:hypothetical protein
MTKPELINAGWLGSRDEMDRASHRFGKCSSCHEIIGVEKAVTDGPSTQGKTSEMLYEAFRTHVSHAEVQTNPGCTLFPARSWWMPFMTT